jgi:hypothetical protein
VCALSDLKGLRIDEWPEEVERVVQLTDETTGSFVELYKAHGL